jgi:polysaccharide deacetylase family protein (PEP-CTERM system associated)
MWALEELHRLGFQYDSSVFPCHGHDRYGVPDARRTAHRIHAELWEIPPSTYRVWNRNIPVAGGGYFRLYPLAVTRHAISHLNAAGQPAVVYLHPWEFDPGQPVVRRARWSARFRHYVNLDRTETRLRRLLGEYRFGPMSDLLAHSRADAAVAS